MPAACKHLPDRRAAPQVDGLGRQEGVLLLVAVQGQVGQVSLGIAAEEVEDAVTARVRPGRERRPGHRRLGRARGRDARKPTLLPQPRQVGQLARFEQPRDDSGVQTVQTDDDDLLDGLNLRAV